MEARLTCRVSFARGSRDDAPIRQGETDDVVKVHQSSSSPAPRRSGYDVSPVFCPLSLSLSLLPWAIPFHPLHPRASPRLTGEAAERSIPFLAPILHRFRTIRPASIPLSAILSLFAPFTSPVPSAIPCLYSRYTSPSSCSPQRVTLSLIQHAVPASQRNVIPPSINPSPSTNTFHVRLCEFALISTCALCVRGLLSSIDWFQRDVESMSPRDIFSRKFRNINSLYTHYKR